MQVPIEGNKPTENIPDDQPKISTLKKFEMCSINSNDVSQFFDNAKKISNFNNRLRMNNEKNIFPSLQRHLVTPEIISNVGNILNILSSYDYTNFKCMLEGEKKSQDMNIFVNDSIDFLTFIDEILLAYGDKIKNKYPKIIKFINDMESDVIKNNNPIIIKKFNSTIIKLNNIINAIECEKQVECKKQNDYFMISTVVLSIIIIILIVILIVK